MDDPIAFLFFGIVGAVLFGIAGFMMLQRAGREGVGFVLGFFLGPIGLVIAFVMRDNAIRDEAERARQRETRPAPTADVRKGFGSATRAAVAAPPLASSNAPSPIDALERLATLREKGHLTEEEFEREKRKLIAPEPKSRTSRFR